MPNNTVSDYDILVAKTIYEKYYDESGQRTAYRIYIAEMSWPDDYSWSDKVIESLTDDIRDLLHNGNSEDILTEELDTDELTEKLHDASTGYLHTICTLIAARLIAAGLTE